MSVERCQHGNEAGAVCSECQDLRKERTRGIWIAKGVSFNPDDFTDPNKIDVWHLWHGPLPICNCEGCASRHRGDPWPFCERADEI